jgi:hypothetical protein
MHSRLGDVVMSWKAVSQTSEKYNTEHKTAAMANVPQTAIVKD